MKEKILFYLERACGKYVSGAEIAKKLACSRMAVSKAVAELKKENIEIESSTRLGYRLVSVPDALRAESVLAHLKDGYTGGVYCHETLPSTNDEAKRLAATGATHGTVIVADSQSAGRGRRLKSFHSPAGTGIYMSVIIKPNQARTDVLYTVAAAVAVRRVLDRYTKDRAEIKWVNDIYIAERKVCGILCEAVSDLESGEITSVICGIGVNLNKPLADFPEDIQNKAGYVTDKEVSRALVVAELAGELLEVLTLDSDSIIREYSQNMMLIGREIYYRENETLKKARVCSVDGTGGLVVVNEDKKTTTLRSGEVHLEKF